MNNIFEGYIYEKYRCVTRIIWRLYTVIDVSLSGNVTTLTYKPSNTQQSDMFLRKAWSGRQGAGGREWEVGSGR